MIFHLFYCILLLQYSQPQEVNSRAYQLLLNNILSKEISNIGVDEAKTLKNPIFIDSRTFKEYEVSHIKGAIYVGYESPNFQIIKKIAKDQKIVVYCSVGYRSEKITAALQAKGFSDVHNLFGGIFEWKNKNLKVYKTVENPTDSIHAYNKAWSIWLDKGIKVY